jgi:hypothetical protein
MRVGILAESPYDALSIRMLADAILGFQTQEPSGYPLAARSWPRLLNDAAAAFVALYYGSDAEGLIVVADTDHSPVHRMAPQAPQPCTPGCRLCDLRQSLAEQAAKLTPVPGRAVLKTAVGVAVPEIHAWYRSNHAAGVNETAWINGLHGRSLPYTIEGLKRDVYGSTRPSPVVVEPTVRREATQLAQDVERLEQAFPSGFGSLARDLRGWLEDTP